MIVAGFSFCPEMTPLSPFLILYIAQMPPLGLGQGALPILVVLEAIPFVIFLPPPVIILLSSFSLVDSRLCESRALGFC